MDWSLIASTFALVFLAEMGHKTQLAAISLAASTRRPVSIATGAIAALAA
jgi:putative Ca2+/H+ antiporter (TMEM165/GDT1 family)